MLTYFNKCTQLLLVDRKKMKGTGTDESESDVYEVERILRRRRRKGGYQYLVKWTGYEQCTWEPRKNLFFPLNGKMKTDNERNADVFANYKYP